MKMPHEVYLILAVLGSVLTMATVIGHVLRPPIDNLKARIHAWW